jgi:hypothetical protein
LNIFFKADDKKNKVIVVGNNLGKRGRPPKSVFKFHIHLRARFLENGTLSMVEIVAKLDIFYKTFHTFQ